MIIKICQQSIIKINHILNYKINKISKIHLIQIQIPIQIKTQKM
jgi:hypothetical protein